MARKKVPALCRQKAQGYGYVSLNGHQHYCGEWPDGASDPPEETQAKYNTLISQWLAGGRNPLPSPRRSTPSVRKSGLLSVLDLTTCWLNHADLYYRRKDGSPTSEGPNLRYSMRALCHLHGELPADDLRPSHLKEVRSLIIRGYSHASYGKQKPCSRGVVNQRVAQIVRAYRWAVEEELVSEEVWLRLTTVKPLREGRSEAFDHDEVAPVDLATVERTIPHLSHHLAGAVRFQLYTGCRPGEALAVCLADLERDSEVWIYTRGRHKSAHRGKQREIAVGPKAQAVLREFIRIRCAVCGAENRPPRLGSPDGILCGVCFQREGEGHSYSRIECQEPEECLFHPKRSVIEAEEDRQGRYNRQRKQRLRGSPGKCYGVQAYCRAIARVCEKHDIPAWHPNQLRHTRGTQVRRAYGLEGAQVALGHAQAKVTEIYAERDRELARKIARETG